MNRQGKFLTEQEEILCSSCKMNKVCKNGSRHLKHEQKEYWSIVCSDILNFWILTKISLINLSEPFYDNIYSSSHSMIVWLDDQVAKSH